MKTKKIAFITPIYLPAPLYGSDNAVRILAEEFLSMGHDVSVITSNALVPRYWYDPFFGKKILKKKDLFNKVKVYRLPCSQLRTSMAFIFLKFGSTFLSKRLLDTIKILSSGPYLIGLRELFQKEHFDVVHCSPFPLQINKQVVDACRELEDKPKIILTPFFHTHVEAYHNDEFDGIMQKADSIHAISFAEKRDIEAIFPGARGKTVVIPLFLRRRYLHTATQMKREIGDFKSRHGLTGKKIVLFAGLKGRMKGAIDVLKIVESMFQKDSSVRLIAIGHNTAEWNDAMRSINRACVLDFGYVSEYTKEVIFSLCDVFCMPSECETFGYVYLEAWHKRKPVVAADIGSMRELIGDHGGGVMVQFGDRQKLRSALFSLLHSSRKRRALGDRGYRALTHMYSEDTLMRKYIKLFDI